MKTYGRSLLAAAVLALAPASALSQSAPAAHDEHAAAHSAHQQTIDEINARWLELVAKKDAAEVAKLYAENGALMPPGAPAAIGRNAIEAGWRSMFETPGFALTFAAEDTVFSASGDMAVERGTYKFSAAPPSGPISDVGKYIVVWRNIGGQWQVVADIFNSDRPS